MKTTEPNATAGSIHFPLSDGAVNSAAAGVHRVVDKVADAAGAFARKVPPTVDRAAELAHHAVDNAAAVAAPAAEWLSDQAEELNVTQKKLIENTRSYVAANPLAALGFALAAGFLVSRIVR